ncbi:hypothetical protein [Pseudoalteromonas nigrifaciens]|uniref:hypothetical protein n=1 Tax=Pseudoalteromonas nigrifaciens TaxID=28109 RepID=UPI003FD56A98
MTTETQASKSVVNLNIEYTIVNNLLNTEVNYPLNFLSLEEVTQVQLLGSLIEILNKMEVPETSNITANTIQEAHDELVKEPILFPFGSVIKMDLTDMQNGIAVEFTHDSKIASLHPMHTIVLLDSIIKVLKAMAVMIVRKTEQAKQ